MDAVRREMAARDSVQRRENLDLLYGSEVPGTEKRNPYLVDFENRGKRRRPVGRRESGMQDVPAAERPRRESGIQDMRAAERPRRESGVQDMRAAERPRRESGMQDMLAAERPRRESGIQDMRAAERPRRESGMQDMRAAVRPRRESGVQDMRAAVRPRRESGIHNLGMAEEVRRTGQLREGGRGGNGLTEVSQTLQSRRIQNEWETDRMPQRQSNRRAAQIRRRRRVLMQRVLVGVWALCILVLAGTFILRNSRVFAGQGGQGEGALPEGNGGGNQQNSGILVQGLPAEEFAGHPAWTEDFLTPNEYSRPGDALENVKNIFVHYTANPGTSAAQNRSYFDGLKDTHETSASAHFIIGYEGEIIQCVPLDEIAYAVQSRNFDSVSIECCYVEADGSFTQETYDSLISLLAWLTDIYDLESEDILRHYDCGGKKCPLYYTENPDAWEELKKDVDKL